MCVGNPKNHTTPRPHTVHDVIYDIRISYVSYNLYKKPVRSTHNDIAGVILHTLNFKERTKSEGVRPSDYNPARRSFESD